jgi:hypothetical protein
MHVFGAGGDDKAPSTSGVKIPVVSIPYQVSWWLPNVRADSLLKFTLRCIQVGARMKASLEGVEAEDSQCRIALAGSGTLYAWGLAENGRLGLVRRRLSSASIVLVHSSLYFVPHRETSTTRSCFSPAMTALGRRATSTCRSRRWCWRCCSRRSATCPAARTTPPPSPVRLQWIP